jgi:hypothetical protein
MNPNEKCKLKFEVEKTDVIDDTTFVIASGAKRRDHVESNCKCALTD